MNDKIKIQPDIKLKELDASDKCNELDTISREAALACFHAWIDKHGDVCTPDDMPEYQAIEALPSVEPEIIRCKDCQYDKWCSIQEAAMAGDEFFCGRAERRTDE